MKKWKIRLKTLLSHFLSINIERCKSEFGNELEINLSGGKLLLDSHNSNYSYGSLQKVLALAIKNIHWRKSPEKILILGFGAGSVVPLLRNMKIRGSITGVEHDSEIIRLANSYFFKPEFQSMHIIHQDAFDFLDGNNETYDLIIIDLFTGLTVPEQLHGDKFIQQLADVPSAGGWCLINTIGLSVYQLEQIDQLETKLKSKFSTVNKLRIQKINHVFLAQNP